MEEKTAIILAGGKSSRMGTDKSFLEIGGKSLLEIAVNLCRPLFNQLLISSNQLNEFQNITVVNDEIKNCGPLGGIYSCLKRSPNQWNFVISVDSPFVQPDFVNFLAGHCKNYNAVVPFSENGKEPLIAFYNKSCLESLELNLKDGKYKMHSLLNNINTNWVDAQKWVNRYPELFFNINSPADFEKIKNKQ